MKALRILIIVALVIVIIPLLGFAVWFLQKGENLEVFLVNKSMVDFRGNENKAMNFILNEEKILTPGNRKYDLTLDHYGLIWSGDDYRVKFPRLKDLGRNVEKSDLFYYADVSGIMSSQVRELKENEEDHVEYGGLNNSDYTLMRYAMEEEKPLIVECSFYGNATDPLVRYNIEKLTDVYYVGWMGKYLKDLAAEPDLNCGFDYKKEYQNFTGEEWSATGPGIVMINMDAKRVIVLAEGEDIHTEGGIIRTDPEMAETYNLPEAVNFTGWFTVLHPGRNELVSRFVLNPTESGQEKLLASGLPEEFPALIHGNGNFYFMAGDFGKNRVNLFFSRVFGVREVITLVRSAGNKNPDHFFYTYYRPFMLTMIDEAREKE